MPEDEAHRLIHRERRHLLWQAKIQYLSRFMN